MTDIKINLDTKEGIANLMTKQLIGKLDSLILNAPSKTHIIIMSELGYKIFEHRDIEGFNYVPIRVQCVDSKGNRISFSFDKINLKEKLLVYAQKLIKDDKPIKIILRME